MIAVEKFCHRATTCDIRRSVDHRSIPRWSATRNLSLDYAPRSQQAALSPLLDIRPGSRHPVLLHGEANSGRRRPPAHENRWLRVNTSDPQSPQLPWLHLSDSAARDTRPLYIRNSTPHEEFAHAWARPPLRLSASSAFQAAPRKIITAESCIQMIKPITAANPP